MMATSRTNDARCILLAVHDRTFAASLQRALRRRAFAPRPFDDPEQLWSLKMADLPHAAIVDSPDGFALTQALVSFMPRLPILVLGGDRTSRALALTCLGRVRVRSKPLDVDEMLCALGFDADPDRSAGIRAD